MGDLRQRNERREGLHKITCRSASGSAGTHRKTLRADTCPIRSCCDYADARPFRSGCGHADAGCSGSHTFRIGASRGSHLRTGAAGRDTCTHNTGRTDVAACDPKTDTYAGLALL